MKYRKILVTGGAGFVGSNICIKLKEHYSDTKVLSLDNLMRRGSELNLLRLKKHGVIFKHGDVRNKEDLNFDDVDLIIECSAEPSIMAGVDNSPEYLLNTNLTGAINCFELARKNNSDVVFLSTSRVYPISYLTDLNFAEEDTRFSLTNNQNIKGVSSKGINEEFPLNKVRSLYGTTKLASELILLEYAESYGIKGIINRCGLITGPWQMGKADQGVIVYWMANHVFGKNLKYIGFGGEGKQVRDVIDIDDLFELINIQISDIVKYNRGIFNVGGGNKNSLSLLELTNYCEKISGNKVVIEKEKNNRQNDIRIYISDNEKIEKSSGWKPKKPLEQSLEEIHKWIIENKNMLSNIFN